MVELALSGPVFQNYSDDGSYVRPTAFLGYFVNDKMQVGGNLGFLSYSRSDMNGGQIGIESAFHFSTKEKIWPYTVLGATTYFGDLYSNNPVQIKGEVGVKYWPLPGGAIKFSGQIIQQFSDGDHQTAVGILIRVK